MKKTNKHGLSRDIPEAVARQVRRECGFGCVICGASIIQYEHFNPDFFNAKIHDPAGIALLCGRCHDRVTRRYWSKDKVAEARERPFCKREGFSWDDMDLNGPLSVKLGSVALKNTSITVGGVPILSVAEPECDDAPIRLSATFTNSANEPIFKISDNRWFASNSSWDMQCEGGRIEIREVRGYCLRLRCCPPNGVEIDELRMRFGQFVFKVDGDQFLIYRGQQTLIDFTHTDVSNIDFAF